MDEEKLIVSFEAPKAWVDFLDMISSKFQISRSEFIRQSVKCYVEKLNKDFTRAKPAIIRWKDGSITSGLLTENLAAKVKNGEGTIVG